MFRFILLLYCMIAVQDATAPESKCGFPRPQGYCEEDDCIPRVTGTSIDWDKVEPRSFVVTWATQANAKCYYIELLRSYTIRVLKTISCVEGYMYKFNNLNSSSIYGVRVSAVNTDCRRGRPGVPARTRTLWAPTIATTTTAAATPSPGKCGKKYFTCHSEEECVPVRKWCNGRLNCKDRSDERGCPGGCEELVIVFKNGNYSCSRWGSPSSVCLFDCDDNYVLDGPWYTSCERKTKKWSRAAPTCRVKAVQRLKVTKVATTNVSLEWEPVNGATRYAFSAVEVTLPKRAKTALKVMTVVEARDCCEVIIRGLKPGTEFQVTVRAVDDEDIDGMVSAPVFPRTAIREG